MNRFWVGVEEGVWKGMDHEYVMKLDMGLDCIEVSLAFFGERCGLGALIVLERWLGLDSADRL